MVIIIASNKKLEELDILSGISIIFVVLIHSNARYLTKILGLQSYLQSDYSMRLLDNFIHGAVTIFIFIAGYKYAFNNIDDKYKTYCIKKLKSVIKPFLIIGTSFWLLDIIRLRSEYELGDIILNYLNLFRGYSLAYQLWFVPMYLMITITYPIINKYIKKDLVRVIFIAVLVVGQKILGNYFDIFNTFPFTFVYYYIFFEMGLQFHKYNLKEKIIKYDIVIILFYIMLVFVLSMNPINSYYEILQMYILWPLSIVAYYLISIKLRGCDILKYFGQKSFFIFLIHEPIIGGTITSIFQQLGLYNSIFTMFIVAILGITSSVIVNNIIQKTMLKKLIF